MRSSRPVTVALDLLGGDFAPDSVIDGALLALGADVTLTVTLVGPPEVAARGLDQRSAVGGTADRLRTVPATQSVGMHEDPARAVRARRDATVRVAARLVASGAADAMVSVGSSGAAMAAAVFALGRLPGMTRAALATVVPGVHGPVVLLDAGANVDGDPGMLEQFALAGAGYAAVRFDLADPRVALLSIGSEPGRGDRLRREAHRGMAALPLNFVGNVEGHDVPYGGVADVVVTDGFTGNVLLKGMEGAFAALASMLRSAFEAAPERAAAARELAPVTADVVGRLSGERLGGAVLLGVEGICVVGHGDASPPAVAACLDVAAQAARHDLLPRLRGQLADLVARRRAAAGFPPQPDRPPPAVSRGAGAGP